MGLFGSRKDDSRPDGDKAFDAEPVAGHVPVQIVDGAPFLDLSRERPPTPFVAVLELLQRPGVGDVVVAVFPRNPIHLYPELAERGWNSERLERPGPPTLRITRSPSGPQPGKKRPPPSCADCGCGG